MKKIPCVINKCAVVLEDVSEDVRIQFLDLYNNREHAKKTRTTTGEKRSSQKHEYSHTLHNET